MLHCTPSNPYLQTITTNIACMIQELRENLLADASFLEQQSGSCLHPTPLVPNGKLLK